MGANNPKEIKKLDLQKNLEVFAKDFGKYLSKKKGEEASIQIIDKINKKNLKLGDFVDSMQAFIKSERNKASQNSEYKDFLEKLIVHKNKNILLGSTRTGLYYNNGNKKLNLFADGNVKNKFKELMKESIMAANNIIERGTIKKVDKKAYKEHIRHIQSRLLAKEIESLEKEVCQLTCDYSEYDGHGTHLPYEVLNNYENKVQALIKEGEWKKLSEQFIPNEKLASENPHWSSHYRWRTKRAGHIGFFVIERYNPRSDAYEIKAQLPVENNCRNIEEILLAGEPLVSIEKCNKLNNKNMEHILTHESSSKASEFSMLNNISGRKKYLTVFAKQFGEYLYDKYNEQGQKGKDHMNNMCAALENLDFYYASPRLRLDLQKTYDFKGLSKELENFINKSMKESKNKYIGEVTEQDGNLIHRHKCFAPYLLFLYDVNSRTDKMFDKLGICKNIQGRDFALVVKAVTNNRDYIKQKEKRGMTLNK